MTECWAEGTLRAYHDGELLPAEMEQVEAHLAECSACEALADELAGRAMRVQNLLAALPGPEQVIWMPRREPQPLRSWPRWAAAAAAIAAGITIALVWPSGKAPSDAETQKPVVSRLRSPQEETVTPVQSAKAQLDSAPAARKAVNRKPSRPREVFLALDDEPIETGVVLRVALGDAGIPADVVFGADGRARAIRLVGSRTTN